MASGTTTPRVRLVRCPKCRMVLPEVEDIPLYKCGGCDVILVVKNRKGIVESTFPLQEIGDADSDKLVHVSENGESASSTPQEVHLSPAAGEVLSSDILFASPNEHMEQPRRSEHQGFNHVRSTDSFETADFVSPSSEFGDPDIEHFSKSVATGISHAYDGGIPSDDGMDDQLLCQEIHSFENNYRDANYLAPEERQRREKSPAESLMNCNARNLSSDLSNKKPYGTSKYRKWHQDEALEPVMHQCLRDEYPSRIPFSQRTSLPVYKNAGPSCELHDESPDYSEQESMKLLRMVSELQDQISKRCNLNDRKFKGRASIDVPWRQKHFPTHNYPEEETFYPRHDIGKSCLCCHARVWPRSEQLPHPMFCRVHPGHSCYDCYRYCPSSPQRHMESGFSSWSHEIIPGDQRYVDGKLKRYSREKHYSIRRYRRPIAGGAPFVTCYHCFRPLEVPADFLLSQRRSQQLRCGACLKVLRLSLRNGTHIVPYEQVGSRTTTNE